MQAQDIIASMPIRGEAFAFWRDRLAAGRLAVLARHLEAVRAGGVAGAEAFVPLAERLLGLPEAPRRDLAATPEFGAWISEMRDRFERGGRTWSDAETESLLARAGQFLLLPLLRGDLAGPERVPVPVVPGGLVAIPGTPVFFALGEGVRRATCRAGAGGLDFAPEGAPAAAFTRAEVAALLAGAGPEVSSLSGLAPGGYRLAELRQPGMYLGLPVNEMLSTSLVRMARAQGAGDDPDSLMTFAADAGRFAGDVDEALGLVERAWPEMAEALALHTRFVAPILSERVYSYSELAAPNAVFLRATPQNPLWYVELLVHESCHNWLASLMELVPIIDATDERRFVSPWRADARPLIGILFGTHAFAFVTLYLVRLLQHGTADAEVVGRRVAFEAERVSRGYALLREEGRFTPAGSLFLDDLGRVVEEIEEGAAAHAHWAGGPESSPLEAIWPTVT
ncbi:MAG TPA: HEXXH motif-containing putative peptide modification protein [Longimicrobiaceae bacterium]|nr:HEXXH motif-containing putative peptide modification protein [Longimicrobiaceae bacterium]